MVEVKAGVFIGRMTAKVRDELWTPRSRVVNRLVSAILGHG